MQVIEIEANGNAPWEVLRKYGGKYRFFEKIKMGGVGSSKIVYQSGFSEIDALMNDVGSDLCYINFEYLKKGILGRVNKGQKLIGVIMHFDEIEKIHLSINLIEKSNKQATIGLLEIFSFSGEVLVCGVSAQGFGGIEKFFRKGIFQNKFIPK